MNRPEPRDGFDADIEAAYADELESRFDFDDEDEDEDYPYYGDDEDYDGQPSEYDEWMSYDPDC